MHTYFNRIYSVSYNAEHESLGMGLKLGSEETSNANQDMLRRFRSAGAGGSVAM